MGEERSGIEERRGKGEEKSVDVFEWLSFFPETYEKRQANNVFWSPNGQFCVLAGLRR